MKATTKKPTKRRARTGTVRARTLGARVPGLTEADRQLPRSLRRVLARVRRPLNAAERALALERGLVVMEARPSAGHPGRRYYSRADLRAGGVQ